MFGKVVGILIFCKFCKVMILRGMMFDLFGISLRE